jgi:hypothetical protein
VSRVGEEPDKPEGQQQPAYRVAGPAGGQQRPDRHDDQCRQLAWGRGGQGGQLGAAELTQDANDFQQLHPMRQATAATLAAGRIAQRPGRLAADSGHWSIANLTQIPVVRSC